MKNARDTAIELLHRHNLWPVPIRSGQKAPIGYSWGAKRPTEANLQAVYDRNSDAGVGVRLGPEAGVIDIECDGPEGPDSLARLMGGECLETMGWSSSRGPHRLFRYDHRLERYGKAVIKARSIPGLEIRIGGKGKQLQSNCPPTVGDDGKPREWNDCWLVADLPDVFFDNLDAALATATAATADESGPLGREVAGTDPYVARAVEAECRAVRSAPQGERNASLNAAAFSLGRFVGAGAFDRAEAERLLIEAGADYVATDGEPAALATIRSGLNAGQAKPRDLSHVARRLNGTATGAESLISPNSGRNNKDKEPPPWPPLQLRKPPPTMPFPVDVFPPSLEAFCREAAESTRCPIEFIGLPMLTTAGAAVGQSVNIEVKRNWHESPLLYSVIVAPPGKAKSPAIHLVTRPLLEIDEELRRGSKLARERWEERKRTHAKDPSAPPPGPEPPRLRAVVDDITRESLCDLLSDNPRGVLCSPDETTAWVGSWNQYKAKGGTDRQFWLSLYSGKQVSVDRKGGRESLYVPHPFAAVLGSVQPDLLASLKNDRGEDGFLDRLVFCYPGEFPPRDWTDREVSPEAERDWSDSIRRLHAVDMQEVNGHPRPRLARFTPEARALFIAWYDENGRAMDEPGSRSGALSKAEARCARFALILSRLRLACDPCQALQDPNGVPPVDVEDVEGAIRLTEYFADHLERVIHQITNGVGNPDALALIDWVTRNNRTEFREANVREHLKHFRNNPGAMAAALVELERLGAVRRMREEPAPGKSGRKASPGYEVHPDLLGAPGNRENEDNYRSHPSNEATTPKDPFPKRFTSDPPADDREVFEI